MLAAYEMVKDPLLSTTLEATHSGETVIVRLPERSFEFPVLAASVELPEGWTHLSTTNPSLATNPTFINEAEQSVIHLASAYGIERAAIHVDDDRYEFDGYSIDWVRQETDEHVIDRTIHGIRMPLRWTDRNFQRVGLLTGPNVAVMLAVISPNRGTDQAVRQFCMGIESFQTD